MWRAFQAAASGHPFQHFDWLLNWHLTIGEKSECEPFIVIVHDEDRMPVLLLPLCIERNLGFRRLTPMGDPVSDYHGPLVDAKRVGSLDADRIHKIADDMIRMAEVDYLLLTRMPPLLGDVPNPLLPLAPHPFSSDAHAATLGTDWDGFYTERRGTKTRRRFREKEKALAKAGAIVFEVVTEPRARRAQVEQIMPLKAEQLVASAGTANIFADRGVQDFFLAAAADPHTPEMVVFRLTVGGELAAAVIGLVRDETFYYQVPVYPDNALQRHSPGALLLHRLMAWAIENGYSRFDFTIGDEGYKSDWCDDTWHLRCGAYGTSARGMIGAAMARTEIELKRRAKQNPAVLAQAIRLRSLLGKVRAWTN